MASDFSVVFTANRHFGDQSGLFDKEDADARFVGHDASFSFDTPGVDPGQPAMLQCRSYQVSFKQNVVSINGTELPFALTLSVQKEWKTQSAIIPEGVLKESGNTLTIKSHARSGDADGNLDDFLVGAAVVTYRT